MATAEAALLLLFVLLLPLLVLSRTGRSSRDDPPLPPGPKGWPVLGNLPQLGPMPHRTLAYLAQAHGPLVHLRLGFVHAVVASSSAVASAFLRTNDANFSGRPPNSAAEHITYNYQDMAFAPYGPRWRTLRKLCSVHLFSSMALDASRTVREQEVLLLARRLAGVQRRPVNVGEEANVCVANALARSVLGRRMFGGDAVLTDAREFMEMVVETGKLLGAFNVGDFVPGLRWLDLQGLVWRMKALHRRYDALLDRLIEEKTGLDGGEGSLLSVLLGLKGKDDVDREGGKVTDTDIKALLLDLFSAGTDTMSSTVEWALSELVRHPDILRQLQHEIDYVVGHDRLVADTDLPSLPFLHAVAKETFRLHPPTPLSLPRRASERCVVDGYLVPAGATLLVNVWAIGRDPAVWTDPAEFRPSRFLPGREGAHVDVRGNDFEAIPFGSGRRKCPGMGLGIRMVELVVAALAHGFDWGLPEGEVPESVSVEEAFNGLTLQRAVPLVVGPSPRLSPAAYQG